MKNCFYAFLGCGISTAGKSAAAWESEELFADFSMEPVVGFQHEIAFVSVILQCLEQALVIHLAAADFYCLGPLLGADSILHVDMNQQRL